MSEQGDTGRSGSGNTPRGPGSTGCRLHKPEFDRARDAAEAWTGREGGLDHWALHARLEVRRVRERFGLKPVHVEYLRLSFKKLFREDFEPGGCPPTVWISKRKLAEKLDLSPRTISNIEKDLARAGFLYWTDTASRRRDGERSKQDSRIRWAHGVTFAPLDTIASEIEDAARLAEEEKIESNGLVHRISTIRCHTRILLQAALRRDEAPAGTLQPLLARVLALPDAKRMDRSNIAILRSLRDEALDVEHQARTLTEPRLDAVELPIVEEVEPPDPTSPEPEKDAEIFTLGYPPATGSNSITDQFKEKNTLVAAGPPTEPSPKSRTAPAARPSPERGTGSPSRLSRSPVPGGPPAWLILDSLSPRLSRFLPAGRPPTANEFFESAGRTRSELGISPEAWRDACTALSPAWASMAVVIVASRDDAGEIHTSAGGYFRKLTERAREGTLNLAGSLWGVIERSEQLHVDRVAPATEGEHSIPGPDPGLRPVPLRVGGQRADQATMAAICRTAADPRGLLLVWRELVSRYRCWPYLDEVERQYEQLVAPQAAVRTGRNSRRRAPRETELHHA
ncbi:MAG: replication initiation protein RepC [Alphaproteobacteria bacterium]|nr:replication initiation protein RepC [Alphaproteobacteria bacterium]